MSNQCDCGDQECAICCGRTRNRTPYVDPYFAAKEEAERAAQQAQQAPKLQHLGGQPGSRDGVPVVGVAQPVPVVQVEPTPVAQLENSWAPPAPTAREAEVAALAGISMQEPPRVVKTQTPFARAYTSWQKECARRNQWISELQAEWKARVARRAIAMAQWDAHVAEARKAYEQAKLTQPPPQPRKEQFTG